MVIIEYFEQISAITNYTNIIKCNLQHSIRSTKKIRRIGKFNLNGEIIFHPQHTFGNLSELQRYFHS